MNKTYNTDSNGNMQTTIVGSLSNQPFSGSTTVTHTFTSTQNGFGISNDDSTASLTYTIGSDTYTVLAGEGDERLFAPFTVVTVTTTTAYRAWGLI